MQKVICLALLALAWLGPIDGRAQSSLDSDINLIVNDLVAKMRNKPTIKNVAVADFTSLNGTPTELGKYLAEQFSYALVNANTSFSVIDRSRLNFLLKEAGLDAQGLLDPNSVAKLGNLRGVDAVVVGTMTSIGENLDINVKVLKIEQGVNLVASKGSIRRTPAIIELEGKELGGGSTGTAPAQGDAGQGHVPRPSPITTFEKSPLLYECLECKQSGNTIVCRFRITSKGKDIQTSVYGGGNSKIIDDEGLDFYVESVRLGNNTSGRGKDLVSDVPIIADFTFSKVDRQVKSISKMDVLANASGMGDFRITLKNIPVKH